MPFAISGPYAVDFLGETPRDRICYHNAFGRRVRAYRLRVRGADGSEVEVHRRYSQFQHLVAVTPRLEAGSLPCKSFWRLRLSSGFRDDRSLRLSALVAEALALDPFAVNMVLRRFLGIALPGQAALGRVWLDMVQRTTSEHPNKTRRSGSLIRSKSACSTASTTSVVSSMSRNSADSNSLVGRRSTSMLQ